MYRWTLGSEDGGWRKEVPFHCTTNSTHHARSALKPWANLIGTLLLGGRCTAWSKLIIRLRKGRPGPTTLHAWLRRPMSDSNSFRVQFFRACHSASKLVSLVSLSCGSLNSPLTVSMTMPKKVTSVAGPSVLWSAMGTPSRAHSSSRICS